MGARAARAPGQFGVERKRLRFFIPARERDAAVVAASFSGEVFQPRITRGETNNPSAKTNGELNWPDRSTNWKSCQASRKTTNRIDCIMRANDFTFRSRIIYSPFLASRNAQYLFLFSLCGLSTISALPAIDNTMIKFRIRCRYYFTLSFAMQWSNFNRHALEESRYFSNLANVLTSQVVDELGVLY